MKKNLLINALFCALTVLLTVSCASAAITNGNFETGDLTGWGSYSTEGIVTASNYGVREGNHSAVIVAYKATGSLIYSQEKVNTEVVALAFKYMIVGNADRTMFTVSRYNSPKLYYYDTSADTGGWVDVILPLDSPLNANQLNSNQLSDKKLTISNFTSEDRPQIMFMINNQDMDGISAVYIDEVRALTSDEYAEYLQENLVI